MFKRNALLENKCPKNVVRCQDNRWVDEALVFDWVKSVQCWQPGTLLRCPSLVLDAFAVTWPTLWRNYCSHELVVIPGGTFAINKPFKDWIRCCHLEWMRSEEPEVTATGQLKRASAAVLCSLSLAVLRHAGPQTYLTAPFCGKRSPTWDFLKTVLMKQMTERELQCK